MIKWGNVNRHFNDIKNEYISHLETITKTEKLFNGKYTQEVEKRLSEKIGRHVLLVTSGSIAMTLILNKIGIGPGDEVITINYGPPAVVGPIKFTGATPKYVDIDQHGCIDCNSLQDRLSAKTKAVIAVGLYGDVHDHDVCKKFCDDNNLVYINDANQSAFASYKGKDSMQLGQYTTIGFSDSKPLPTLSTFGAIICDTENDKEQFNRMRKHGKPGRLEPLQGTGLNAWPDEQGAIQVMLSMNRFDNWQARRKEIANYYRQHLKNVRTSPQFSGWNTHKFAVFFDDKMKAKQQLLEMGVETVPHYTESFGGTGFPNTNKYIKSALSLPLNPYMSDCEVDTVVQMVKKLQ